MNGKTVNCPVNRAVIMLLCIAGNVTHLSTLCMRMIHVTDYDGLLQYIKNSQYIKNNYGFGSIATSNTSTSNIITAGSIAGSNLSPTPWALSPAVVDQLLKKMVTVYTEDKPLVICVDNAFTSVQVREIGEMLEGSGIKGVVISGARAGTGLPIHRDLKEQYQHIDTLGCIAMVWERRKDLNLTDLLKWYHGEDLDDDHFAAAVDVYFQRVYGD